MTAAPSDELPLAGVRVLDFSRLLPGPMCTQMLADFGADVIKIEDTGAGDYARWGPSVYPDVDGSVASPDFAALNRNKRSIRLDLKSPASRDALESLLDGADVVVDGFRPGVMGRLGLDHDTLSARDPRIITCSISGYGASGPLATKAGHDLNYLARNGIMSLSGDVDGPPAQLPGPIGDVLAASAAAYGILLALRARDRSGQGQAVDVAISDAAMGILATVVAEAAATDAFPGQGELLLGGGHVCYRPYRCSDGWMALGALEEKFWLAWCDGVGRPDLREHQHAAPGTWAHSEMTEIFAGRSRAQWEAFAVDVDCCLEPVLDLGEALASGQAQHRGLVVDADLSGSERPAPVLSAPLRMSLTPPAYRRLPVPALGEHTTAVLRDAGLSLEQIQALFDAGAAKGQVPAQGEEQAWT